MSNFFKGMMGPPPGSKRPADMRAMGPPPAGPHNSVKSGGGGGGGSSKKKKRLADKILPQKVRELVPESQAYMDLLAFERKLDSTIMRKRLDIQVC
jgi:SWI/SNF-related matrix-associated actin-dependent regulator of chromatin subfamily D